MDSITFWDIDLLVLYHIIIHHIYIDRRLVLYEHPSVAWHLHCRFTTFPGPRSVLQVDFEIDYSACSTAKQVNYPFKVFVFLGQIPDYFPMENVATGVLLIN